MYVIAKSTHLREKLITSTRAEKPADITPNTFPASKVGEPH
jgi:hypothetical protein